jgi:hypothetical protein
MSIQSLDKQPSESVKAGWQEVSNDVAVERHYTITEIAKQWHMDYGSVRPLFEDEPGVLKFGHGELLHKRSYISLRVPESVMIRVHRRLRRPN